jgi:ATP-dependent helicase/nuclease subunit A
VRSAADRGTLLHALLERIDFRRPVVPAAGAVAAAAARARLTPAPGAEEADELAAVVRQFAGSALCGRLARASEIRREERFAFALAGGTLMVGALDVLAREPGERALVVDYKSDRLAGADPAAVVRSAYATQRLVYALAALQAGAEQVEIAHCFLERPAEPVTATFSRSQAPELETELHGLTRGVLAREFAVAPAPYRELCSGCPAEGGLCSWRLEQTRREAPDRLF